MHGIVFLNVAWMRKYRGLIDDKPVGDFEYIQERGFGHEIFNFQPYGGRMYGYARVNGRIAIERLGASKGDTYVDDVLVVWVSKRPQGGVVVIGWYEHARVFRCRREGPLDSGREYEGEALVYRVMARAEDCALLPVTERTFPVPARVPGGLGQANIWYADTAAMASFRVRVLDLVRTHDAA